MKVCLPALDVFALMVTLESSVKQVSRMHCELDRDTLIVLRTSDKDKTSVWMLYMVYRCSYNIQFAVTISYPCDH